MTKEKKGYFNSPSPASLTPCLRFLVGKSGDSFRTSLLIGLLIWRGIPPYKHVVGYRNPGRRLCTIGICCSIRILLTSVRYIHAAYGRINVKGAERGRKGCEAEVVRLWLGRVGEPQATAATGLPKSRFRFLVWLSSQIPLRRFRSVNS